MAYDDVGALGASSTGQPVGDITAPDMSGAIGATAGMPQFQPPPSYTPQAPAIPSTEQGQPQKQSTLKKILIGVFDTIAASQHFPTSRDYEDREFRREMEARRINIAQQNADSQLNYKQFLEQMKIQNDNSVPVGPEMIAQYPQLEPYAGKRLPMRDFLGMTAKQQADTTKKLVAGYDAEGRPLPVTSLAIPARMKVELAGITSRLQQARLDAANYDQNTPAGIAARIKLEAIQQQARAAVTRAAAASGMEQIAAAKYAQDYVMGTTDVDTGQPVGLNQARLKAMSGKIPPALAKTFMTFQQSKSRLAVMENSMAQGLKGDQQAMLNILANHLGMTMGLQPGARMNQALIHEAEQASPIIGRIQARFDDRGYLTGVVLTPEQMKSMVELAQERVLQDSRAVSETEDYFGVHGRRTTAPAAPATDVIYARDPQGKLHKAAPNTPLPQGWKLEQR